MNCPIAKSSKKIVGKINLCIYVAQKEGLASYKHIDNQIHLQSLSSDNKDHNYQCCE